MSTAYERLQQRKKNKTAKASSENKSPSSAYERLQQRKKQKEYNNIIGFDTLESDIKELGKTIQSVYDGWQTEETMNNTRSSIETMQTRVNAYQEYQKTYGNGKGADPTDLLNNYKSILEGWDDLKYHYSKYKNADDYNKALAESEAYQKELDSMPSADLNVVQTEIDELQKILDTAKSKEPKTNLTTTTKKGAAAIAETKKREAEENAYDEYLKSVGYSSIEDIEKALSEKKVYKNKAQRVQEGIYLSSVADEKSENYDPNFDDYSAKGTALGNEETDEWYISGYKNQVAYLRNNPEALEQYFDVADDNGTMVESILDNQLPAVAAKYMNDDEAKIYDYYVYLENQGLAEEGIATKYLRSIEESLKQRQGTDIAKERESLFSKYTFGYKAGIDQFTQGMINVFNTEDDYIPATAIQNASAQFREDIDKAHGTFGQGVYDLITTTSNMAPSILASSVSNVIVPGSGAIVGAGLMGGSAAGNAYQEMLNQGYDKGQARTYSTLIGVSEAGLQYAFGGISKLGGKLTGKTITAIANGVDKALGRFAIKYGLNMASEGLEEAAQEILNPFFENLALGYSKNDLTDIEWGEVAYSGVLGALSAGLLEGGSIATSTFSENITAKKTGANIRANAKIGDMLDTAALSQEETDAYNLYTQYANKGVTADNISDLQIGRLHGMLSADAQNTLSSKKSTIEQKANAQNTLNDLFAYSQNNSVKANLTNKEIAETYGGEETTLLIKQGLESGENTESHKIAKELKTKMENGENITTDELARLADANTNAYLDEVKTDAKARLTDMGESTAEELSTIIAKKTIGEKLTTSEKETLQKNKNATLVYNEINHEELVSTTENMAEGETKLILSIYDDSISVDSFMNSYNLVKDYAINRFSDDYVFAHKGSLTHTQASAIYGHFISDKDASRQKYLDDLKLKHKNAPFQFGNFDDSVIDYNNSNTKGKVNWKDLNNNQKSAIAIVGTIAQQSGLDVELILDGYERGIHGAFEISGNKILIDVYAGMDKVLGSNFDNFILPTLSHEMTHWMKEKAPELYRKYDEYVFETLMKNGETEGQILSKRRLKMQKAHPGVNYTDAQVRDEVIARASEDMLGKSEVIKGFVDTLSTNEKKTFVEKIKEILQNIKDWFNSYLDKVSSKAPEAKKIREATDRIDGQIKLWDAMLKSSIETNQVLQNEGITGEEFTKKVTNKETNSNIQEMARENGNVKYYQNLLEDLPISEYNKLTTKKPIQVSIAEKKAVESARTKRYAGFAEENIPIIDVINLGEYGVLNSNDYYFIRNADKLNYSIVKHSKTIKRRQDKYANIRNGQARNKTNRGSGNGNERQGIEGKHDKSNSNNRPSTDQQAFRKNVEVSRGMEKTDRRISVSESSDNIGRGVKYSDRDEVNIYDLMGENKRLIKENEQFKADVERLKERLKIERRVTHGNYFNENQLNAVAGHLRNIANSNYSKPELVKQLKDVYSYIAHSDNLNWEDLMAKSYEVAKNLLSEAREEVILNDYFKEMLRDIRKTKISLNEKQIQEAKFAFGNNYHKFLFGKFNIAKDGLDLDIAWQQWASKYPRFDTEISDGDQITELYKIYEEAKEGSEMVVEYNEEERARWLASEIYNQYWNVSPIRTTADKYDKRIKLLNFEHRRAMKELRDGYNERLAGQKKADREKYQKLAQEIRERKEKEIAEVKRLGKERMDKYKENAERKTKIQSITANALTLNKWLTTNSKDYHIHENMKAPVITLLQAIDFSSKRLLDKNTPTQKDVYLSKALSKVKDMMADATNLKEGLEELYGHNMDEDLAALVDSVNDIALTVGNNEYVLNRMSLEELKTLDKLVKTIKHTVSKLNTFHTVHHNKGVVNLANDFMAYGEKLGKLKKQYGKIGKFLKFSNCTPYYFFKRLGEAGKKLFEAFQDGWDKLAFNSKQIIDFTEELYTDKEVKEWTKGTKTFKLSQPDGDTRTFEMSIAQIMALYCVSKQEDAKRHLLTSGMTLSRLDKKGNVIADYENISLSIKDLTDIFSTLTDRQKEVADKLQEFMNTVCSDWGNEISMARFGVKMFDLPNYFPIKVSPTTIPADNTEEFDNASLFRLLNMSFTKSRNEYAKQSIEIGDIFDIFAQHTTDMAKYNALALPVLDFNKFYSIKGKTDGNKEYGVDNTLRTVFGNEAVRYVKTFVKNINGSQNVSRDIIGKTFFKNAKVAAVANNIRVVLLQPTAYFKAGAVMDNKYLAQAPMFSIGKLKKSIAKAEKYCGIIQWKALGYYDTDISKGIAEKVKHADTFKDKAVEKSLKGAEVADKVTFGVLWNACELEIRKTQKNLKVGSEEFYQTVAKRLREVVYATQVVDSTMTRSDIMRSTDGFDKMFTTFGSEPTIAYNMLMDMAIQFSLDKKTIGKKEAWKKNGKKILKVITSYVVTNAVAALVESAFDAYRDNDDEEDSIEDFLKAYLKNFALDISIGNKLPIVKEMYSVFQGYSSSRMDTQWMEYIYGIFNAKSVDKKVKYGLKALSDISGLAFYNLYRDLFATLYNLDILSQEDIDDIFS